MYVVDTDVLSSGAPTKMPPRDDLIGWMDSNSALLYLSVITVAEVESGIAKARREGGVRKAAQLAEWLDTLLHLYSARVLPVDIEAGRVLGAMVDRARGAGRTVGLADLAIAATAKTLGYTILTRNIRRFHNLDVEVVNPFDSLPLASRHPRGGPT